MGKKSVSVKNGDKEITLTGFSVYEVVRILRTTNMDINNIEKKTGVEIKE